MGTEELHLTLLVGSVVLLVSVSAVRLSARFGVPTLLLYLGLGMLLGENVLGLSFDDAQLARNLGLVALAMILAEGGLTTRWLDVRPGMPAAAALATVGVAVSIGVTCVAAKLVLDVDWRTAGLTAAVLSSTDAAAASAHASGFLAVYLTSLWLGNARLPHRRTTVGFADGLAWLAQIGLFVMLGLLATPARLGSAVLPALAIGAALLLVARPLSVLVSTSAFRFSWRDQVILSAAGLRGAVPIVLTTIPLTEGSPHARKVFDVVFVVVAMYTLIQSPLIAPLARRLGLVRGEGQWELDVEAAPLDTMIADLLTVHVPEDSKLHRVEVWELALPAGASLVFIIRDRRGIVPEPTTTLRAGDDLLIVVSRDDRERTEQRLRAVSRSGRLARFYGDRGD
jgi:cell volume regulation protein A